MSKTISRRSIFTASASLPLLSIVAAGQQRRDYEVTVTNLTRGQRFTPILVATHIEGYNLFRLGEPASSQLRTLAEEGNTGPLVALLSSMTDVIGEVVSSPAPPPLDRLTAPGKSITLTVHGGGRFDRISVAAMLIPTNDGFFAVDAAVLPQSPATITVFAPAYDAGTERNDELCASIPGPGFVECATPSNPSGNGGGAQVGQGEGYVHIHAGMHGVGNMSASMRDWRNPVARVTIRRTS
ncbi:MAG: spondin domain-containing protein [Acidobacteria bacterium]|nr:spondin domain-containing protein [Acidobacteriota bacterium]